MSDHWGCRVRVGQEGGSPRRTERGGRKWHKMISLPLSPQQSISLPPHPKHGPLMWPPQLRHILSLLKRTCVMLCRTPASRAPIHGHQARQDPSIYGCTISLEVNSGRRPGTSPPTASLVLHSGVFSLKADGGPFSLPVPTHRKTKLKPSWKSTQ